MVDSLWGEEFDIASKAELTSKLLKKIKTPKKSNVTIEKQVTSKSISLEDKIKIITEEVYRKLGKQKDNIVVIRDKQEYLNYINSCLNTGVISIDTETNNSTDPINCKLMGLCLYAPGLKQAYIPVNHVDYKTGELLSNQLTTEDCKDGLELVLRANPSIIMQNGKFDYQVLKCTCGVEVKPTWDTMIAGFLIDENDEHGLKYMYRKFIDQEQEKYDIETLFDKQQYSIFPPEVFALYAATDALMTHKVYEYQKQIMEQPAFEKIYKLFKEVEMPCVTVTAEMELSGVTVDVEYFKRLQEKYTKKLNDLEEIVKAELEALSPKIMEWSLTPEANERPKKYPSAKEKIIDPDKYPEIDNDGKRFKFGKSKVEQIDTPISLTSPVQLAILFYDILKCPVVNNSKPRATGENELKLIYQKTKLSFCKVLLEHRGLNKILTTYINNIPELVEHWSDHRIRTHFSQTGTDTGRFSSGGKFHFLDETGKSCTLNSLNFQNIPSHLKEIRMMFKAKEDYKDVEITDENFYEIDIASEILTSEGWKKVKEISIGDIVCGDDTSDKVINIERKDNKILLYVV